MGVFTRRNIVRAMKKIIQRILLPIVGLVVSAQSFATDPYNVFGLFLTEERNSVIEISECNESVCGNVVWLNPETLDDGVTPEEAKSKSGEKVLGLTMLQGFEKAGDDWREGTIYDPGKDKTYSSRLERLPNGTLQVGGCISFFCQTQIWTSVESLEDPLGSAADNTSISNY